MSLSKEARLSLRDAEALSRALTLSSNESEEAQVVVLFETFKRHSEIYRSVIEGDSTVENLDTKDRIITLSITDQIKGLEIVKIPY